jgi:hypothetical protein
VHPRSPSTLAHPRPSDRTRGHCSYAPHFGRPGQASRTSPPDPRRQNRAILRNPPPHAGRCSPAASPAPRGRRQNPGAWPLCPPLRSPRPAVAASGGHAGRARPGERSGLRGRAGCAVWGSRAPRRRALPGRIRHRQLVNQEHIRRALQETPAQRPARSGPGRGEFTRDRGNRRGGRNWGARRTTR